MRVHFMNDEALTFLQGNISSNLPRYQENNLWVTELCEESGIKAFSEFKMDVPEITFKTNLSLHPEKNDVYNTKVFYSALKKLSDSQATDPRFWVGLAHSDFWDFMGHRLKLQQVHYDQKRIESNFFCMRGKKDSLFRHALARMWWVGRLTYDKNAVDPFESLKYLHKGYGDKVKKIFKCDFSGNPAVTRALLKSCMTIEQDYGTVPEQDFHELLRYVNLLGGILILDYLTEEELKEKILNHYASLHPKVAIEKTVSKPRRTRTRTEH